MSFANSCTVQALSPERTLHAAVSSFPKALAMSSSESFDKRVARIATELPTPGAGLLGIAPEGWNTAAT